MEQVELDNAEQKVGSYLNVMVTNDGSDLFLHTGAKPTIKGSFGFKVLDEKLQFGETEKMLRSMLTDQKMAEYEQVGEIDFLSALVVLHASVAMRFVSVMTPQL